MNSSEQSVACIEGLSSSLHSQKFNTVKKYDIFLMKNIFLLKIKMPAPINYVVCFITL